eukprot:gb/GECH01011317.1/.p1 GENE.gb/GECH01011317.1/~~gb/GECH01011317.1/.p1  ORF type:complete len:141 (+),score=31.50 gb/GECH01011317.1/:1-423(+)
MNKSILVVLIITLLFAYVKAVVDPTHDFVEEKFKNDRAKWETRASNIGRVYYVLPKNMRNFQTLSELEPISFKLHDYISSKGFDNVKFETVSSSKIKMTVPSEFSARQLREIRELVKSNPNVEHVELKPDFKLMGGAGIL